ncbi:hypothetical protein BS756_00525, partial [Staphylococcus sp. MB371]
GTVAEEGDTYVDVDKIQTKDESEPTTDTVADRDGGANAEITTPKDTDGDGIPDKDDTDIDGDGVSNEDEELIGTDPANPNTDGKGITDDD